MSALTSLLLLNAEPLPSQPANTAGNSVSAIKKKYIIPEINFEFTDKIKLDLDYPEDLILAEKIFKDLGNDFHMKDILRLFSSKPELVKDSTKILEKWKKNYAKKTSGFRENKQHMF